MFQVFYGTLETAPIIRECPVNLECKMVHSLALGSHKMVVGEIIETYIDEDCITDGNPDPKKIDLLVYATGTTEYHRLREGIGKAFDIGISYPP